MIGHRPATAPLAAIPLTSCASRCVAWIEAPALIDRRMIEQPCDRALARPGEAILDLLHLLGDVDMDRPLAGHRDDIAQALGRHRAQAVRRDADDGIVETRDRLAGAFEQARVALDIVDEPALPLRRRRAAEAALRVEDRQQRQADAGLLRRGRDAMRRVPRGSA